MPGRWRCCWRRVPCEPRGFFHRLRSESGDNPGAGRRVGAARTDSCPETAPLVCLVAPTTGFCVINCFCEKNAKARVFFSCGSRRPRLNTASPKRRRFGTERSDAEKRNGRPENIRMQGGSGDAGRLAARFVLCLRFLTVLEEKGYAGGLGAIGVKRLAYRPRRGFGSDDRGVSFTTCGSRCSRERLGT